MKKVLTLMIVSLPVTVFAQSVSGSTQGFHYILDKLYDDMTPLCSGLTGMARAIGGFASLWYIGSRVWKSIAVAEPVDIYPLMRPFALGFCILIFPSVMSLINAILQPTVTVTYSMVKGSNDAIKKYLYIKNNTPITMQSLSPLSWAREVIREFLELVFDTATLCINTIRTFYLVVLTILGPLVFALSIFDGFQHTVTVWLARYINIYLWLPVANIFGAMLAKIQANMILADQHAGSADFIMTDLAYLMFLLVGIAGFFTVPSVANYIVNAGGGNALLHKVTSITSWANKERTEKSSSSSSSNNNGMASDSLGNKNSQMKNSMSDNVVSNDYFKDQLKAN
ncbi:MAG: conjugative transposon protein TraJ [Chitinophagaceae bacterium]|nr:conjugative transposon protein TraJ [Chitinophagaceae bacterium]